MASLKQRARAVAMAAISEEQVRRDPARVLEIAMGAARGFVVAASLKAQSTDTSEG